MWPHVQILINPELKTGFFSKAKALLFGLSQLKMEEKNIMSMKFKVHGVRGSVSNSSPEFDRYGGNTSCYEIEIDDCQIVIDTGTGFHNVELMRKKILKEKTIQSMAHLGSRAFGTISGEIVQTTATVFHNISLKSYMPVFIDL